MGVATSAPAMLGCNVADHVEAPEIKQLISEALVRTAVTVCYQKDVSLIHSHVRAVSVVCSACAMHTTQFKS